jgi:hypothetical protein
MRIHSIGVAGVRGVDVGWEWRPLAVLFGPNDSSKTNILEVLLALLSSDPGELRKQSARPHETGVADEPDLLRGDVWYEECWVLVELDGRDLPGHRDRDLLASAIQFGIWGDPDWLVDMENDEKDRLRAGGEPRGRPLRISDREGDDIAMPQEPVDLDELVDLVREGLLAAARDRTEHWASVGVAFEIVLDWCLRSPYLLWSVAALDWAALPSRSRPRARSPRPRLC